MRIVSAALAAVLWMTAGCDRKTASPLETKTSEGQSSDAPAGSSAARKDQALVRFINADPSGKDRELWAGETRLFTAIAYKTVTPYIEIPSQATQFGLRASGETKNLAAVHDELFAGRSYTYVALPGKKGASLAEISDDFKAPKSGKARVRLINATLGMDNLELHRSGNAKSIGSKVRTGASTDFKDVDPGSFDIQAAKHTAPPRLANLIVDPDRFYTFVILGRNGDVDAVRVEERLDR